MGMAMETTRMAGMTVVLRFDLDLFNIQRHVIPVD